MAKPSTASGTASVKDGAEAQIADTLVAYDQSMAEITMAKRLYEIWRTTGQLSDPKWEWARQTATAQHAWLCVARAASPLVLLKTFGVHEIAQVNHG